MDLKASCITSRPTVVTHIYPICESGRLMQNTRPSRLEMPIDVVKLCTSYVSDVSLGSEDFISAAEFREEEKEEARAADAGSDDEKQQSTCEQIMTNCVIS